MKARFFDSQDHFREWLRTNHRTAKEILVGLRKGAKVGSALRWSEAVDQALCFGWIDGVRKRLDDASYSVRFTPRKKGSTWSAVNIRRIAELEERGLLRAAGRRAFEERREEKSRTYSYEQDKSPRLGAALQTELESNKAAARFFLAQAPSYRRKIVHWIMGAKAKGTQERRLRKAMAVFEKGRRL